MKKFLTIGQFADILNVSTKTLRYYEKKKLLIPAYKDPITGYRYYDEHHIKKGYIIRLLRSMEVPLKKMKNINSHWDLLAQLIETSKNLEDHIKEKEKLIDKIKQQMNNFSKIPQLTNQFDIKLIRLPFQKFECLNFEPSDSIDFFQLYTEGVKLSKKTQDVESQTYALLELTNLSNLEYLCYAMIQEIPEFKESENPYFREEGLYLSLIYRGSPTTHHDIGMKKIKEYSKEHSLEFENIMFSRPISNFYIINSPNDYLNEILIKIKEDNQ